METLKNSHRMNIDMVHIIHPITKSINMNSHRMNIDTVHVIHPMTEILFVNRFNAWQFFTFHIF